MKKIFLNALLSTIPFLSIAQLDVWNTLTGVQMVEKLSGPGVIFTNIDVSGCPIMNQMAEFNGINSNIGIDSGLIMTTGDALLAMGPNTEDGATGVNGLLEVILI